MANEQSARFSWQGTKDVEIATEVSIPNNLKSKIKGMPKERKGATIFLEELQREGKITEDEVVFLLSSRLFTR